MNFSKKSVFAFSLSAFFLLASLSSCTKSDNVPPVGMGHLYFDLHNYINQVEADSGTVLSDVTGRRFKLTSAQFYISSIQIFNFTTNNAYILPLNTVFLKTLANNVYYVADVPAGSYGQILYNVGLTPAQNSTNPSMYPAGNPLAAQTAPNLPMYWNASEGYISMNIQGLADTTKAHNGPVNFPFSYQIGGNNMTEHVWLPAVQALPLPIQQFTILPGQNTYVHQICDYGNLLYGIPFVHTATPFNSNSTTAWQVAFRVRDCFINYQLPTVGP